MTTIHAPLTLPNGAVLRNRLAKAATSERLAADGDAPGEAIERLYRTWGAGGVGLIITGNVMVDRRALGESGNVAVEDERHLAELRAWSQAARAGGARIWMQLNHPGRQSPRFLSPEPVAPSAVQLKGGGMFARPRALAGDEIRALVDRFARSAQVAAAAGFDGVQLHGAHGYLVSQFLSPLTNLREDEWGGDPARRRRFLLELVRAVKAAVPAGFSVGVKLNSADFQRGGFSEDESLEVIAALEAEGIDLLEISGGTYESAAMFDEPAAASTRAREAFFLDFAERVRSRTRIPLMVTGGFRSSQGMNDALSAGAIDLVGLARPLAVEPDLPARLLAGAVERARPVRLATGWKKLDALIQATWYQQQIERLGRGLQPSPTLWRLRAILGYLFGARPRRRALAA
jgi:2,4-dienoyl-CoA reductase-like NADH-dependent reductase (Old Yellow Enzyme family)